MTLYEGLFYPGTDLQLVHYDTVGFLGGSALCLWNLSTLTKDYIMSQRRGYQSLATNYKQNLIALAEYGRNPGIIVHHKIKESHFRIDGLAVLEIPRITISNEGKHLLAVCGLPDNCVKIYNLEKRQQLKSSDNKVELKSSESVRLLDGMYINNSARFDPANSNHFFLLYNNEMILYSIETDYEIGEDDIVHEQHKILKLKEYKAPIGQQCIFAAWDERNHIYLLQSDSLEYINAANMTIVESYPLKGAAKCLVLTQRHVIVFYTDGRIQWLNKYYEELVKDEEHLRPFVLDHTFKIGGRVSSALYNHNMSKLFVGHSDAQITILKLEAEKSVLNDEQQEKNEGENKDKHKRVIELHIDTQVVGGFHTSSISMLKELSGSPVMVSASQDGIVNFWSLANKNIITSTNIGVEITCGDINKDQNIICIGTSQGIVLFYEISENHKLQLIYEFKLYDKESVSEVGFSPVSDELAVCSHGQRNVFFILTNTNSRFQVLGYSVLPYEVTGMSWNTSNKQIIGKDYPQLFVLVGFAILGLTAPDAKSHHRRGEHLRLECQLTARKIDPEMTHIAVLASGQIVVTGKDKVLRKYKQPEQAIVKVDFKVKAANTPPIQELEGHDLAVTCMSFSARNNELVTGSLDGTIMVRNGDILSQVKNKIQTHNMMTKGVSVVLGSNIGKRVYTAGHDGSLFIWTFEKINLTTGYVKKQPLHKNVHKHIESKHDQLQPYHLILEKEYMESVKEDVLKKKKQQLVKIDHLKTELRKIIAENQKDEELQRLDRDQFAIDIETRDKIQKQGLVKCEQMRKLSQRDNLRREIMANRIKQKTWDTMEIQLKAINGLKLNILVYNYQVRKRLPEQERKFNLVLQIRRQNIRQQKYRKQKGLKQVIDMDLYKNKSIVNGGFPTVLVFTDYEKVEEKKDEKLKKKKDEEEDKEAKAQQLQVQTDEEWGLMYNSMQLFSNNSKRNQIIMIKNIIFKIKSSFNKEFDKVLQLRQQQTEIIREKNKRISEIYEDLKRPIDPIVCKKNVLQNPEKVLSVDPNELVFKKYLSREERERLEKERLKEEERLRLLAQDDAGQRALGKMMGGTLEEKKQSVLQVVIEREKWMDKPVEEMSQDEKMKMKEYQVKKQKAQEEKERTIKKLEAEYRKLKQEIEQILDKFDQKLFVLFRRKLEYDYRIEEQELYASKLAASIITVNEAEKKKKILELERSSKNVLKNKLTNAIAHVREFAAEISKNRDQKKAGLEVKRPGEVEGRIKNIEKNVFDELKVNEKKRKELENRWIAKDPNLKNVIISLDPYLEIEQRLLYNQREREFSTFLDEIRSIQQNYQGNEQVLLNALETRFNLKKEQAELEKRYKSALDFANNLETELAKIKQDEIDLGTDINEYGAFLESSQSNIEVQFRLKQGCIEISQEKPICNLAEALLIPRAAIQDRNAKIIDNADEKIKVMENIKTCKISVTEEALNLEKKLSLANELQHKIKEVQMLKVKKEMQSALAKKDIKMNDTEIKNLTDQIENLKKEADKRISVFQNKIDKINSDIEFIRKENTQLQVQKWNLESTVKQRQKIQQMNGQTGSSNTESKEKFEQISTNRKLFDKAKKQTEEIELLREELSKLKAKTFANFSNIQR